MTPKATFILRCPKCDWTFETDRGDRFHPHCSTKKPEESDVVEDITTKVYDCRNTKCLNPITVYYYRATSSFERC